MRRAITSVVYWLFVATLSLLFAEFTLWWWDFKVAYTLKAKGVEYALPFELDRELLYRFIPSPQHHINRLGFRDGEFSKKNSRRRIAVVGDSFPMGLVVTPEETFPKRMGALHPDVEVLNLGVQGYGPDQELLSYRRIKDDLAPDHVVWSLFPSNDLNDLIKNHLLTVGADGKLLPTDYNPVHGLLPLLRSPMFMRGLVTGHLLPINVESELQRVLFVDSDAPSPVTVQTFELLGTILETMRDELRANKVGLTIVVIPSRDTVLGNSVAHSLHDAETVRIARSLGITTIDLSKDFMGHGELYSDSDHHLSAAGHDTVARRIIDGCGCLNP